MTQTPAPGEPDIMAAWRCVLRELARQHKVAHNPRLATALNILGTKERNTSRHPPDRDAVKALAWSSVLYLYQAEIGIPREELVAAHTLLFG